MRLAFTKSIQKLSTRRERSEKRCARPRGMRRMRPMFGEAEFVRLEDPATGFFRLRGHSSCVSSSCHVGLTRALEGFPKCRCVIRRRSRAWRSLASRCRERARWCPLVHGHRIKFPAACVRLLSVKKTRDTAPTRLFLTFGPFDTR